MELSGRLGEIYTTGVFLVKPGNEATFIATWRELVERVTEQLPDAIDRVLLQDLDQPRRFITFGRWTDAESWKAWIQTGPGKEVIGKLRTLCEEDVQVSALKSVAYMPSKARV